MLTEGIAQNPVRPKGIPHDPVHPEGILNDPVPLKGIPHVLMPPKGIAKEKKIARYLYKCTKLYCLKICKMSLQMSQL